MGRSCVVNKPLLHQSPHAPPILHCRPANEQLDEHASSAEPEAEPSNSSTAASNIVSSSSWFDQVNSNIGGAVSAALRGISSGPALQAGLAAAGVAAAVIVALATHNKSSRRRTDKRRQAWGDKSAAPGREHQQHTHAGAAAGSGSASKSSNSKPSPAGKKAAAPASPGAYGAGAMAKVTCSPPRPSMFLVVVVAVYSTKCAQMTGMAGWQERPPQQGTDAAAVYSIPGHIKKHRQEHPLAC